MGTTPPRTIALSLETVHNTVDSASGASGLRSLHSESEDSDGTGAEGDAAIAGRDDDGDLSAGLETDLDAETDTESRDDDGEADDEADNAADDDATESETDRDTDTETETDNELVALTTDADREGEEDGDARDAERERDSVRDIVGDTVALFVALLLFAARNRLAAAVRGGCDGSAAFSDTAGKIRAAPTPALVPIFGTPTRSHHGGNEVCDVVLPVGYLQMRKMRLARSRVKLAGGTRSKLVPSAAMAAARKHETVRITLDEADETNVVPRRTPGKVTALVVEDAGSPLPTSTSARASSDSVTLVGLLASAHVKPGCAALLSASLTVTTMSGSGVCEI